MMKRFIIKSESVSAVQEILENYNKKRIAQFYVHNSGGFYEIKSTNLGIGVPDDMEKELEAHLDLSL